MIEGLERFVDELRRAGLRVSPAEWLEALRGVEIVGLDDRGRFRQALACAIVKRREHRQVFAQVFDRFFVGPSRGTARGCRGRGAGARDLSGLARGVSELLRVL